MHFSEALRVQREEYLALLQTQFFMLDMFSQLLPHVSHCFSDEDVGGVTDRERLQMYALERQLALGALRNANESYDLNDLPAIKAEFGDRLCFLGGIDIKKTMRGSIADVEGEVALRIEQLGAGGGYILAPANHLQADVPTENVVALYAAARRHGHDLPNGAEK